MSDTDDTDTNMTKNDNSGEDTIPLYTTTPQQRSGSRQSPDAGRTAEGSASGGPHDQGDPGTGKPYATPYVYVSPQHAQPGEVLHKTGPSAPTIVFGSLLLFLGVVTLFLGL